MANNKVLYLYENEMPTVSMYRQFLENHDEKTHYEIVSVKTVSAEQFNSADVVEFIRPVDTMSFHLVKKAKELGKYVIIFCDDDLYEIDTITILDKKRKSYFRKALALADLLQSSSPRIAERYKAYVKSGRVSVSDTVVDSSEIVKHQKHQGKVRIVYAAGACHTAYFNKYINPILNDLYNSVGDVFSLTFIGVHPEIENPDGKIDIRYLPMMPLTEYRKHMAEAQYDIGLAPIGNDEFSKCKYFNKYLEYSMMGVCGIYTNSEPYTYAVQDGFNGILAGFDPQDWLKAIITAISDEKLRDNCVEEAQRTITVKYSNKAKEQKLHKEIPELYEFNLDKKPIVSKAYMVVQRIKYKTSRVLFYILSSFQLAKKTGMKATFLKIKNHM